MAIKARDTFFGTDVQTPPWEYPTLSMSMEMKKTPPLEDTNMLCLWTQFSKIKKGRLDTETLILG